MATFEGFCLQVGESRTFSEATLASYLVDSLQIIVQHSKLVDQNP